MPDMPAADDWLIWFTALPQPVQDVLTGATGDLAGGLVAQAALALIGEAAGRVRRRLSPTPQQAALRRALARGMVEALSARVDDPLVLRELLTHFSRWLERPDVAVELAPIIDPNPDVTIDLARLEAEFAAAGFAPELLGEELEFAELMGVFVTAFYDAACREPELRDNIELQLLRGMVERLETLVTETRRQSVTLQAVERRLAAIQPFDLDALEQAYLDGLYRECNRLPLATADEPPDAVRPRQPRLQRVYVDLTTTQPPTLDDLLARLAIPAAQRRQKLRQFTGLLQGRRETALTEKQSDEQIVQELRRWDDDTLDKAAKDLGVGAAALRAALAGLTPVELMQRQPAPQLVLLGDPGSGKSTLTRRLAAALAGLARRELRTHWNEKEAAWAEQLVAAFGRPLLPVRVVLSTWARHLPAAATGCAADLVAECARLVRETAVADPARQAEHFERRLLADPPSALLLLDGLDEVTDLDKRGLLLTAVEDFCAHFGAVPLLVTCRVHPYTALQLAGQALPLPAATLDSLALPSILRFIERWHSELTWAGLYTADGAGAAQERLRTALVDHRRSELREMAGTPLLLTMMARTNYRHGLPNSRAELYEKFVQLLLWEWERQRQDDRGRASDLEALLGDAGVHKNDLERGLNELAYAIHGARGHRGTVEIGQRRLCDALENIFPGNKRDPEVAGKARTWALRVLALIGERSGLIVDLGDDRFRFTHRTFQEYLAARWMATGRLLPKFRARVDDDNWREAVFLALGYLTRVHDRYEDALGVYDNLLKEEVDGAKALERLLLLGEAFVRQEGLRWASQTDDAARAAAVLDELRMRLTAAMQARTLAPRTRLGAGLLAADLTAMPPGLDDFIPIPSLPGVRIGKYPVTNTQFRRFMDDDGYDQRKSWWSDHAIKEIEGLLGRWPAEPLYWDDERFNHSTQPVVGVSWYEAKAYCAWLTGVLRSRPLAAGGIGGDTVATLPSEAEWMAAARCEEPAARSEAEDYPWRGPFATWRANTEENKESDLGQTSPVHMYPGGATAAGVCDMAGNVWEWTRDQSKEGWYWQKGGSWWSSPRRARAAARVDHGPRSWNRHGGFRVVLVPSLA